MKVRVLPSASRMDPSVQFDRKAFFNETANTWDKRFLTNELTEFLKNFIPKFDLRKGERILDLGTGTGVLIPHLLRAVGLSGSIVAVDFAEKMVQICQRKFSEVPNVDIELQNVEDLNFNPDSFDDVVCFGLFPHIENKEKALLKMNYVLKQNGRLIIAHALSSGEIKQHHSNVSSELAHDTLPNEEEMARLLTLGGFSIKSLEDRQGYYLCIATKE